MKGHHLEPSLASPNLGLFSSLDLRYLLEIIENLRDTNATEIFYGREKRLLLELLNYIIRGQDTKPPVIEPGNTSLHRIKVVF